MSRSGRLRAAFFGGPGFTLYHAWGTHGRVPLAPHFHDEYLICTQLRGQEACHVAGKLHQFSAGDVVLINPQQVHTGNTEGEDVEYLSLYVDRDVVYRLADEAGASTQSPEFTVIRAEREQDLVREMCTLLECVQHHGPLYPTAATPSEEDVEILPAERSTTSGASSSSERVELLVEEALHRVVVHAFEEFSNLRWPRLRSTNRVGHRKIARAVEYIRSLDPATETGTVALDDLAKIAGLSKYHFLRQFDQVVGMTPGAYLRTLRLCHAARMLRTTERPIVDIALNVGFADHPSFSRAFVRHMGMTPSEYRRLGPL